MGTVVEAKATLSLPTNQMVTSVGVAPTAVYQSPYYDSCPASPLEVASWTIRTGSVAAALRRLEDGDNIPKPPRPPWPHLMSCVAMELLQPSPAVGMAGRATHHPVWCWTWPPKPPWIVLLSTYGDTTISRLSLLTDTFPRPPRPPWFTTDEAPGTVLLSTYTPATTFSDPTASVPRLWPREGIHHGRRPDGPGRG